MPGPRGLIQRLDQQWHRHGPLPREAKLLVAVSGGADSVALLRLLAAVNRSAYWQWELVVGHVDHGLRGHLSRDDAGFVRHLARTLGLAYVEKRLHLPRKRGGEHCSEDTARQGRLRALQAMASARRCTGVVLAHHADDQAETVLMHMFRGCGLDGLSGMAPESQWQELRLFRPLLIVRRLALRQYLTGLPQSWREDHTNASSAYLRNRVRQNLMPLLEILWPKAVDALGRLAALAHDAQSVVAGVAQVQRSKYPHAKQRHHLEIPRAAFRDNAAPVASEMLRQMICEVGGSPETADFERIREAVRILQGPQGGKHIEMGSGVSIVLHGGSHAVHLVRAPKRGRKA